MGKKRASKVLELSDCGIAFASGLPVNSDQSHVLNFLKIPNLSQADTFIKNIGKKQYELGFIDGGVVSCDSHNTLYSGKIDIQKDKESKDKYPSKCLKVHVVCDQRYRNPIYINAKYAGVKAVSIGKELIAALLK